LGKAELVDQIGQIMVKRVVAVGPEASLATAARLMVKNRVGSVVVAKNRRLVGIITESDFIRFASIGCDTEGVKVNDYMKKRVVSCNPSCRIVDALMIMKRHGIRHLPVVTKARRLLGMISLRDLVAACQLTSMYII
jgi:CBS domain-containing protein